MKLLRYILCLGIFAFAVCSGAHASRALVSNVTDEHAGKMAKGRVKAQMKRAFVSKDHIRTLQAAVRALNVDEPEAQRWTYKGTALHLLMIVGGETAPFTGAELGRGALKSSYGAKKKRRMHLFAFPAGTNHDLRGHDDPFDVTFRYTLDVSGTYYFTLRMQKAEG